MKEWIGIFDNYISPGMCEEAIKYFERQNKYNKIYDRFSTERAGNRTKKILQPALNLKKFLGITLN